MRLLPSPAVLLIVGACATPPETPAAGGGSAYVVPTEPDCVPTDEVPNDLVDQDCDGQDRIDRDLDGHSPPWGGGADCDDEDAAVHPDAAEACNGVDDDCDGEVDPESPWYADADGDGWGANQLVYACEAPAGYVAGCCDCADHDATVFPGAPETCDGVDEDCEGDLADELDLDADGVMPCEGDCDDLDAAVHGFAAEACDGVDNDCDGVTPADETDADADGWRLCDADCDDTSARARPLGVDVCGDGLDNDCDGAVDAGCFDCDAVVPGDHATIQDGLDAAADGDVVCVAGGTYVENLDFGGAAVTLLGVHGPDATALDGGGLDSVVRFVSGEGAGAVLTGFTVTNGSGDAGGGVRIEGSSPTLTDLVVTGNVANWTAGGGGIYVEAGAPTLTRVRVTANSAATSYCGAFYGLGGGLYLDGADAVLEDVLVEGNFAGEEGGGLYLVDASPVLTHVAVRDNGSGRGGGAGLHVTGGAPSLTNVIISGNTTGDYWGDPTDGGGMRIAEASPTLTNVIVAGNAAEDEGGGLYLSAASPVLVDVVITGNTGASGGGLFVASGAPSLAYGDTWGNTPDDVVGIADPAGADGNVSVDPAFADAAFHLAATSPLVDAGDPTRLDPDGSPSDMGAFGGEGAGAWDLDGDGFPAWWLPGAFDAATSPGADCDDDDDAVFPGRGC